MSACRDDLPSLQESLSSRKKHHAASTHCTELNAGVHLDFDQAFDVNLGYQADFAADDYVSHSVFLQFGLDF